MIVENEYYSFNKLEWDTDNLDIDTYELVLKKELTSDIKIEIKKMLCENSLIYIKNSTNNRENSKFIGESTEAILYDTNVTFTYNCTEDKDFDLKEYNYFIRTSLNITSEDFTLFDYSRFAKDLELSKRMKNNIYTEWISNSSNKENKFFITIESNQDVMGYILYRVDRLDYIIELISVKKMYQNMRIGSGLMEFLRKVAVTNNISKIVVGTQISNIKAINFYITMGFKVIGTTDIYHFCNNKNL